MTSLMAALAEKEREQIDAIYAEVKTLRERNVALENRLLKAEDALIFYATERHRTGGDDEFFEELGFHVGKRAREYFRAIGKAILPVRL